MADRGEKIEAVGGEELNSQDPPQVTPVVPIWSPHQGGVVVAQDLAPQDRGSVGKNDIVLVETFLRRRGGRD